MAKKEMYLGVLSRSLKDSLICFNTAGRITLIQNLHPTIKAKKTALYNLMDIDGPRPPMLV
jgi:hypothetical protein